MKLTYESMHILCRTFDVNFTPIHHDLISRDSQKTAIKKLSKYVDWWKQKTVTHHVLVYKRADVSHCITAANGNNRSTTTLQAIHRRVENFLLLLRTVIKRKAEERCGCYSSSLRHWPVTAAAKRKFSNQKQNCVYRSTWGHSSLTDCVVVIFLGSILQLLGCA